MVVPTRSPIGVMETSTPTLKSSIPIINNTPPIRNINIMLGEIGAIVKHSKRTIAMIGSTALMVSINFSRKFDGRNFNNNLAFLYHIYSVPVDFYT